MAAQSMQKRGLSQIDWAISLAIFLLYVAWFFIMVKPQLEALPMQQELQSVIESFEDQAGWTVSKTPLFLRDAVQQKVVFTQLTLDIEDCALSDEYFVVDNGFIFSYINYTNSTHEMRLVCSDSEYYDNTLELDLQSNASQATNQVGMKVEFDNAIVKRIFYNGHERVNSSYIKINNQLLQATNSSFEDRDLVAVYRMDEQTISMDSYVFAKEPRILLKVHSTDAQMFFDIDYEEFFSDNNYYGELEGCRQYTHDKVIFRDGEEQLGFFFDENLTMTMCTTEYTNLRLYLPQEITIQMVFDSQNQSLKHNYDLDRGIRTYQKGMRLSKLDDVTLPIDSYMKIYLQDSELISLGKEPKTTRSIHVKEYDSYLLDQWGNKTPIRVNVRRW